MTKNSVRQKLIDAKQLLKSANIDSYAIDATLLLMDAADLTRTQIIIDGNKILTDEQLEKFNKNLSLRLKQTPVAYILQRQEFMSLNFYVDENVLIPRPDTETLVEFAISEINKNGYKNILEIGTGSGCIAISIAKYCPNVNITAVDISAKALKIAQENAVLNDTLKQIKFVLSDLFDKVNATEKFDAIVSNPPYIEREIIETLSQSVKDFEPRNALDGGADGLEFYKEITRLSNQYLTQNGALMYEIGYNQGQTVKEILQNNKFYDINIIKDLQNHDRVIYGRICKIKKEMCENV